MTQLINFPTRDPAARRVPAPSVEQGPLTPRTAQVHHVTIHRRALEYALAALEPPLDAADINAMRLHWYPDHLGLSRAWNGLRLCARVPLNPERNNLPAKGLAFEALEPFGAIGAEARLTLGFSGARSRQIALRIEPAAGQITVEVGRDALLVPVTFGPPSKEGTAGSICLRHASLFLSPIWASETPRIGQPAVSSYVDSGTIIGRNEAVGTVVAGQGLDPDDLACVLDRLDDLDRRPPRGDSRSTIDASALHCSFEATPRSVPTTSDARETVSPTVACLSLPRYPFDRMKATATIPEHGLEIRIICHRTAPDLARVAYGAHSDPAIEPECLEASRLYTDQFPGHFRIRLSAETMRWMVDTHLSDDRLLLAFRPDGQGDVLLAPAANASAFLVAPASGID